MEKSYSDKYVFDRICMFDPTVIASIKGLYLRCAGQLRSLEYQIKHFLRKVRRMRTHDIPSEAVHFCTLGSKVVLATG